MEIGVRKERMRHYNSQKSILNSMTVEKLKVHGEWTLLEFLP